MKNYLNHFKLVCRHKWYVLLNCVQCGILWQGIVHDLSKFSPTEFITSARYYVGVKSPLDQERVEQGYSLGWIHHKACNKHHAGYWIDIKMGKLYPAIIPIHHVKEMVCDWAAASRVYTKSKNVVDLQNWYSKKKSERTPIHPETERLIEYWLFDLNPANYQQLFRNIKYTRQY